MKNVKPVLTIKKKNLTVSPKPMPMTPPKFNPQKMAKSFKNYSV